MTTKPDRDEPGAPSPEDEVRVLVVDDHPFIRLAFRDATKDHPWIRMCCEAGTAAEALQVARREKPDLVVADVSLGDANGLDLVEDLLEEYPDLLVVIFSMYDEAVYADRAVRAGASGYITKSEEPEKVVEAIETVARGGVYFSPRTAARILARQRGQKEPAPKGEFAALSRLTKREMAVFQMMADGLGADEIVGRLGLNIKTVEGHRRRAKEKLGLSTINDLVRYAAAFKHAQSRSGA